MTYPSFLVSFCENQRRPPTHSPNSQSSLSSPSANAFHRRCEPLLLFFIDRSSFIMDDGQWVFLSLWQRVEKDRRRARSRSIQTSRATSRPASPTRDFAPPAVKRRRIEPTAVETAASEQKIVMTRSAAKAAAETKSAPKSKLPPLPPKPQNVLASTPAEAARLRHRLKRLQTISEAGDDSESDESTSQSEESSDGDITERQRHAQQSVSREARARRRAQRQGSAEPIEAPPKTKTSSLITAPSADDTVQYSFVGFVTLYVHLLDYLFECFVSNYALHSLQLPLSCNHRSARSLDLALGSSLCVIGSVLETRPKATIRHAER